MAFPMIPHSRPLMGPEEEEAAVRVVRSGQLAQGAEVAGFEDELRRFLRARHVVAVSSGTAALHLSLLSLGIGDGDGVALPSYVCAAVLQAIRYTGASPQLVDINSADLNISVTDLQTRTDPSTKAVIAPHMFGRSADLKGLLSNGLPVIEDCAMALGGVSGARHLGTMGALGVLSFYATKVIGGGEGGAVVTNDRSLAERVRDLRDYDGRGDAVVRYNYKMTDLQAAIGRAQLRKLPAFVERRRELGLRYGQELAGAQAELPEFGDGGYPFRYVIRHRAEAGELVRRFESNGIAARRPVFAPIHRCLGLPDVGFPATAEAHARCVSLPLHPSLSDAEVNAVLSVARELL